MQKIGVYRLTHMADPCKHGVWGATTTCMKSHREIRAMECGAIIGIGTQGDIKEKLAYVGVGPKKELGKGRGGYPLITFRLFNLMGEEGPDLYKIAPRLHDYIFIHKRFPRGICYSDSGHVPEAVRKEIEKLAEEYAGYQSSKPDECGCLNTAGESC